MRDLLSAILLIFIKNKEVQNHSYTLYLKLDAETAHLVALWIKRAQVVPVNELNHPSQEISSLLTDSNYNFAIICIFASVPSLDFKTEKWLKWQFTLIFFFFFNRGVPFFYTREAKPLKTPNWGLLMHTGRQIPKELIRQMASGGVSSKIIFLNSITGTPTGCWQLVCNQCEEEKH